MSEPDFTKVTPADFRLRAFNHNIEKFKLVNWAFNGKSSAANLGEKLFPSGSILAHNGSRVTEVKLYRNTTHVSSSPVDRASPRLASLYPSHPHSKTSRYVFDYDIVAAGSGQYTVVANIEGVGDVKIVKYTSLFPSALKAKRKSEISMEKAAFADIKDSAFWEVAELVWDYTMLGVAGLYNLYNSIMYILKYDVGGDIIECGVAKGGSIMMIEEMLLRHDSSDKRRVFALDTFTGFVPSDCALDVSVKSGGSFAKPWRDFYTESVRNMRSLEFERLNIVRGDVVATIPSLDVKTIAILRLDTDTYDSTKFELEALYDRVSRGGIVIIDDYGYSVGCRKSVDEFIADKDVLVQRVDSSCATWLKTD